MSLKQQVTKTSSNLIVRTTDVQPVVVKPVKASLSQIFFARLFDLVLVGIFQFILVYFVRVEVNDWPRVGIVLVSTLLILFGYFIGLPLLFKGQTIGKLVFNIRLRSTSGLKLKRFSLVMRELYFWLLPWIVSLVTTSVSLVIMNEHQGEDAFRFDAYLIYNLGYLFFLLWFVFLGLTIKVQKNHQSGIDLKFGLGVYRHKPEPAKVKKAAPNLKDYKHVSLSSMPANFDDQQLDDLGYDEDKEFQKGINLTDLDQPTPKKQLETKEELLEQKEG